MKRLLVLWVLMAYAVAWGKTYYVDANNSQANDANAGTASLPWKTIQHAANTMVAGDTAIVMAGTYAAVTTARSGSLGSRITFKASGTATTGSWTVHHDYITIDGFTLSGNGIYTSTRNGSNGNYCEILNNHITNKEIAIVGNAIGCLIKGNHLVVTSGPGSDFTQITLFGTNNIAENNEIGPAIDIDAFRFWGHDNVIRNNYVHDVTLSPGSGAHMDMFQTFGDNGDSCYNYVIENNRCINSTGQLFNLEQTGANIHDVIFRNNVFAHFGENANIKMPNVKLYNNTFYDIGFFYNSSMDCSGAEFKNNIFIGMHGWYNNTDYSVGANGNLFRISNGYTWTLQYNFFSQLDGSALKTFDNQTGGINGGAINFTNTAANDFTLLSNSPVINHGTALTGFNYDLNGTSRPQGGAWDMGAYEYAAPSGIVDHGLRTAHTARFLYPNQFKAVLLRQYLQANKNLEVYNLLGSPVKKELPANEGIYLVKEKNTMARQKVVVAK